MWSPKKWKKMWEKKINKQKKQKKWKKERQSWENKNVKPKKMKKKKRRSMWRGKATVLSPHILEKKIKKFIKKNLIEKHCSNP